MWTIAAFVGTTLGKVVVVAVGLLLTGIIAGASLFAMDYGAEAEIIAKDCNLSAPSITAEERWTNLNVEQPIDIAKCSVVKVGHYVVYNVRSERLRVYEDATKVRLIWDSEWLGGSGGGSGDDGGADPFPFGLEPTP